MPGNTRPPRSEITPILCGNRAGNEFLCRRGGGKHFPGVSRILIITGILFLLVVPLHADQSSDLVSKGNTLLSQGHYSDSIAAFDSALALNPDDIQARVNKGTALYSAGRVSEALLSFDIALNQDPSYIPALLEQGRVMLATGNPAGALGSFNEALASSPGNVQALEGKGDALAGLGQGAGAIAAWNEALSSDPGNTLLQEKIAAEPSNTGFPVPLIWLAAIIIILSLTVASGYFFMKSTRKGSPPGTIADKKLVGKNAVLNEILTRPSGTPAGEPRGSGSTPGYVGPGDKSSFFTRVSTLLKSPGRSGNVPVKLPGMKFPGERNPGDFARGYTGANGRPPDGVVRDIAEIDVQAPRSSTGGSSGIVSGLDSLLKTGESGYDGAGLRGILLYSSGDYEGAIQEFDKEIGADPKSTGIALLNVRALIRLGRLQEAFDLDRAVIKQKRNDYEAIVLAATLSEKLGYLDFGLKACTVASRLRRNAADVWELKGTILFKMGNYSESLSSFRQSLDLDGQVGAVWKEYGVVLARTGWYQEAIEAFGKAILLNGETPELRARIEKCLKKLNEHQDPVESTPIHETIHDNDQPGPGRQGPLSSTGKGPGESRAGQDPDEREMIPVGDKNNPGMLDTGSYVQKY